VNEDGAAGRTVNATTTDGYERRRRGRLVVVVVVLLLLLGVVTVFVLGIGRDRGASPIAAADALVAIPVYDASTDAAAADAASIDAKDEALDAGRRKRDGGAPVDAPAAARPVDAAASSAPVIDAAPKVTGTGFLTCTADPFANVAIDGEDWGATPFFKKKIDAGRHEIVLTNPASGAIVKRTTIDVAPGQSITVHVP
jgi:hypothetical protein